MLLLSIIAISNFVTLSAAKTHFVYWNSTNPIFKMDNNDHIIDVNAGNTASEYDQMHLVCPQSTEQHVVYSVTEEEYNSCRVTSQRPRIVAVCDKPGAFRYFTITFRSFSPTPGGLEFKPGQTYYLISTSTTRDLHRRAGGYCSTHNMKMALNIGQPAPMEPSTNQVSINVPRIVTTTTTTTTTTESPLMRAMWGSRVPDYRSDYVYYYQPWGRRHQVANKFVKIEPLNTNSVSALPLTSGSSTTASISVFSTALVILFSMLL